MSLDRMLVLAGFNKKQATINALKESKQQLVDAHDLAIKQVEKGVPLDEGLMDGIRAALATVAVGTGKVSKSIAKKAADLADGVKAIYQDEKAKIELKNLFKSMGEIAAKLETIEKDSPNILKKDERVREVMKVFRDAMEVVTVEMKARALPSDKIDPNMTESEATALIDSFLAEEELLEGAISPVIKRFMSENGYSYRATTLEDLKAEHAAACKRAPMVKGDDKKLCDMLGITVENGKISS